MPQGFPKSKKKVASWGSMIDHAPSMIDHGLQAKKEESSLEDHDRSCFWENLHFCFQTSRLDLLKHSFPSNAFPII